MFFTEIFCNCSFAFTGLITFTKINLSFKKRVFAQQMQVG
ncbi:hypothetical protein EBME_1478 [bacterium endosymbiont of Mortierella elongata FMR23-6]|nr:hypothetical protein EBME_1478 [bacterium endosymbiont of Mortierella elongata FMR23-6]